MAAWFALLLLGTIAYFIAAGALFAALALGLFIAAVAFVIYLLTMGGIVALSETTTNSETASPDDSADEMDPVSQQKPSHNIPIGYETKQDARRAASTKEMKRIDLVCKIYLCKTCSKYHVKTEPRGFNSEADALSALTANNSLRNPIPNRTSLSYYCQKCDKYHLHPPQ